MQKILIKNLKNSFSFLIYTMMNFIRSKYTTFWFYSNINKFLVYYRNFFSNLFLLSDNILSNIFQALISKLFALDVMHPRKSKHTLITGARVGTAPISSAMPLGYSTPSNNNQRQQLTLIVLLANIFYVFFL